MGKKLTKWFDQKFAQCGTGWDRANAVITLYQTPAAISFQKNVAKIMLPLPLTSFLRKMLDAPKWLLSVQKGTAVTMRKQRQLGYTVKDSTKTTSRAPKQVRKVLFDEEWVYLTNRGFRFVNNKKVCTCELKKVGFSHFYSKRKVCVDRIHYSFRFITRFPQTYI